MRPETPLQPSPEQLALIDARRADPAGSLRVLAFAGAGKTTALRLLAEADPSPPSTWPTTRPPSSRPGPASRPTSPAAPSTASPTAPPGMVAQRHRLERRLAAREVAELLAIPALDGLRPAFWAYCAIAAVRAFTHSAAREIDAGHLPPLPRGRRLAFAGAGKTTALRLLAEADPSPALYLAYNKAAQLQAQARFPAHVACRTVHSLAYRATRMFDQRHRLERRLAAREVAELLAIPALDGLRPAFWAYCAIADRARLHPRRRPRDRRRPPPSPAPRRRPRRGRARLGPPALGSDVATRRRRVPLEHDAYLKLWHLGGARLPAGAEVLYLDEAQDANPVTLAVLEAQRPADGVGRRPVAVGLPLPRQRGRDADDRRPAAAPEPLLALRRGAGRGRPRHPRPHRRAAGRAAARRPRDRHHARPRAPALRGAVPDQRRPVRGGGARPRPDPRRGRPRAAGAAGAGRLAPLPRRARAGGAGAGPVPRLGRAAGGGGGGPRPGAALPGARGRAVRPRPAGPGGGPAAAGGAAAGGGGPGAGDGAQGQGAGVAGGAAGPRLPEPSPSWTPRTRTGRRG